MYALLLAPLAEAQTCDLSPAVLAAGRPGVLSCAGLAPGPAEITVGAGPIAARVDAAGELVVRFTPPVEGTFVVEVRSGGAVVAALEALVAPPYGPGRDWRDRSIYVLIPHKYENADPTNDVMLDAHPPTPGVTWGGGYQGGDLLGARLELGHVASLGLDTILVYPPFRNDTEAIVDLAGTRWLAAGYRVRDWSAVDENLGTTADLLAWLNAVHAEGMDVILDLPLTLAGVEHPLVVDPLRPAFLREWVAGDSVAPAPMWLWRGTRHARGVDNGWGLPMIDLSVPRARAEVFRLLDALVDAGFDGFRYDSVQNGPGPFWRDVVARLEARRPQTAHLGEVVQLVTLSWQADNADYLAPNGQGGTGVGFDGIYDLAMTTELQAVFAEDADARGLSDHHHLEAFFKGADAARMTTSVDLYEDPTFLSRVTDGAGSERLRAALAVLFTLDRVPMVFSGAEVGVDYATPNLLDRPDLDPDVLATTRALAALRTSSEALRRGALTWLVEEPEALAFARIGAAETLLVVARPGPVAGAATVPLPAGCASVTELLTTGPGTSRIAVAGGRAVVEQAPHEVRVLRCGP